MCKLRRTIFLMLVSALGCAGSQPVRMQLPPGARIGILNVLEPQMTHVDVGSLRFDSFTKVYNVDWNIPGYINGAIENDLKARGNYTFIPIETYAISFSAPCRALSSMWRYRGQQGHGLHSVRWTQRSRSYGPIESRDLQRLTIHFRPA